MNWNWNWINWIWINWIELTEFNWNIIHWLNQLNRIKLNLNQLNLTKLFTILLRFFFFFFFKWKIRRGKIVVLSIALGCMAWRMECRRNVIITSDNIVSSHAPCVHGPILNFRQISRIFSLFYCFRSFIFPL